MRRTLHKIAARTIREGCYASPLRALLRVVNGIYDGALRPLELTIGQLNLMVAIEELGPDATAARVARGLAIEKSTLSRDLARLEQAGLVRRAQHGRDKVLSLTASGVRKLEAAFPVWEKAQARARSEIPGLETIASAARSRSLQSRGQVVATVTPEGRTGRGRDG